MDLEPLIKPKLRFTSMGAYTLKNKQQYYKQKHLQYWNIHNCAYLEDDNESTIVTSESQAVYWQECSSQKNLIIFLTGLGIIKEIPKF